MKSNLVAVLVFAVAFIACAEPASSVITVTAPARFEERAWPGSREIKDQRYLIVSEATRSFDILWSVRLHEKEVAFFPFTLNLNEQYTFTIEERESGDEKSAELRKELTELRKQLGLSPDPNVFKIHDLIRVVRDGKVIYDREICEVHHRKMEHKEVPIHYGFPAGPTGKRPTDKHYLTLFPHYTEYLLGGCCVEPNSKKTGFVYVCLDCKAAREKWENDLTTAK